MTLRTLQLWAFAGTTDTAAAMAGVDSPDIGPVARATLAHSEHIAQLIVLGDGIVSDGAVFSCFLDALLHRKHLARFSVVWVHLGTRKTTRGKGSLVALQNGISKALTEYPPAADVQRGFLVSSGYTLQGGMLMHFALSQALNVFEA